jgi:hypothetical protein
MIFSRYANQVRERFKLGNGLLASVAPIDSVGAAADAP